MTLKEWLHYGREMGYVRTSKDAHNPPTTTGGKRSTKRETTVMDKRRRYLMGYDR
jgi:hypothetical protein